MSDPMPARHPGFALPIRVYYADTDAGGIVYHSKYLDMAERCRTELLRRFDWPLVGANGENFIVRSAILDWLAPARLDDLITCTTTVVEVKGARVKLRQNFEFEGQTLCNVQVELVHVSAEMRPSRLPLDLKQKFEDMIE